MIAAFLLPFPVRGTRAPYLWFYYKLLSSSSEPLYFIGSDDYWINPDLWRVEKRWELSEASCDYYGYSIPTLDDIARHAYFNIDAKLFNFILSEANGSPLAAFRRILTERVPALEDALNAAFSKLPHLEAILTLCNCPSLNAVASKHKIPVIHQELGPLRAPLYSATAYVDFQGVNGNTEAEKRYRESENASWSNYSLSALRTLFYRRNIGDVAKVRTHALGVVLQVDDDSNLIAFGNGYANQDLLARALYGTDPASILVRAHPSSIFSLKEGPYCIDNSDTGADFVGRCERILTINSSVGLEALLQGTPVTVLGDTSYAFVAASNDASEQTRRLAFYLLAYLVPMSMAFDLDYLRFRLSSPTEEDISLAHLAHYIRELKEQLDSKNDLITSLERHKEIEAPALLSTANSRIELLESKVKELEQQLRHAENEARENLVALTLAKDKVSSLSALELRKSSFLWNIKTSLLVAKWQYKLRSCELFNSDWYLERNADVRQAGVRPLKHYLTSGWREGRDPSPDFDGEYYISRYTDVAMLDIPPLVHYWLWGRSEGRAFNAAVDCEWANDSLKHHQQETLRQPEPKEVAGAPYISVIIPTYNRIGLLPGVIESWRAVHRETTFPYEIIFSDDGSDDGSADYLETVGDLPIKVLRNAHGGASSARNAAIRFAKGERLLIIGDDIYPAPDIINVHAELGKAMGHNVATLGEVEWHKELRVNHLMVHITEIGNEQFSYNRLPNESYVDFRHFYTCNICVPRHFFESESTIFDESFTEYGFEDIELGYRLAKKGLKIYFTRAATGQHFHPYVAAKFCRRQISAGRMAVVFNEMHPGVSRWLGLPEISMYTEPREEEWHAKVELLVGRTEDYERWLEVADESFSILLREVLSELYTRLFRAMYQFGVFQKNVSCKAPLTQAMTANFPNLSAKYWDDIEKRINTYSDLDAAEMGVLATALRQRQPEIVLGPAWHRDLFDEIDATLRLATEAKKSDRGLRDQLLKLRRGLRLLRSDPRAFCRRVTASSGRRFQHLSSKTPKQQPIAPVPGLVLSPGERNRELLIRSFKSLFGAAVRVYVIDNGKHLQQIDEDGIALAPPAAAQSVEAKVFFWPESVMAIGSLERLYCAYISVVENDLDIAVISDSLRDGGFVAMNSIRDNMVFSHTIAEYVISDNLRSAQFKGKVLRLPMGQSTGDHVRLEHVLGTKIHMADDGLFHTSHKRTSSRRVYASNYTLCPRNAKPVVFIFPMFIAVGGVERNTIEIVRQLRDDYEFVLITMERLREEQGSLAAQASAAGARVIELAEIAGHSKYLSILRSLKRLFSPRLLWICNGSPWLCQNSTAIRNLFDDVPIVDQEAYDAEHGWISVYKDASFRSFDKFVAVNRKIERRLLTDFGIERDRVQLIYSAINADRFTELARSNVDRKPIYKKYGLPDDKNLYFYIGRLTDQKQPLKFLELARLRESQSDELYILVGNGELSVEVDAFISKCGLRNVKRIPYVENTLELHLVSSGIIFTSDYEGLPIAMLEALAMGVPVFSSDVGDIGDILEEYEAGDVFDPSLNVEDVNKLYQSWISVRSQYAERLAATKSLILERFSSRTISEQYRACWDKLISEYKVKPQ